MSAAPALSADLQVHPSRWCQLRCRHCYTDSGPDARGALPRDVVSRAVEAAAGLGFATLSVSGGEPLLYGGLGDLLAVGHYSGLRTAFTTNGLSLSRRRLAVLAPVTDLVAVSVDGDPASHDQMRSRHGAFDLMRSRLGVLRDSGLPFGFITTLTQHNVDQLPWLMAFAADQGARQLQVHPLDLQGRARLELPGANPDTIELAVAVLAAAEAAPPGLDVIVDVTRREQLAAFPAAFGACSLEVVAEQPLGRWLPSLVVEPDGWVSPLGFGVDRRWGLGSLLDHPLDQLAERWQREVAPSLIRVVSRIRSDVLAAGDPLVLWSEELRHRLARVAVAA